MMSANILNHQSNLYYTPMTVAYNAQDQTLKVLAFSYKKATNNVSQWSTETGIKFSPSKCQSILFNHQKKTKVPEIKMQDKHSSKQKLSVF